MLYELLKNNKLLKSSDLKNIQAIDQALNTFQKELITIKPLLKSEVTWYQTNLTDIVNNLKDDVKSKGYQKTEWYQEISSALNTIKTKWNALSISGKLAVFKQSMTSLDQSIQQQFKLIPSAMSTKINMPNEWISNFDNWDNVLSNTVNSLGTLFNIGKTTFNNILSSFQSTGDLFSDLINSVQTNSTLQNIASDIKTYVSNLNPITTSEIKDVSNAIPDSLKSVIQTKNSSKILSLNATQTSKLYLTLSDLNYNLNLKVYNAQGQLLKQSQNTGTTKETINNYKINNGTYYIVIDGDIAINKANYNLNIKTYSTNGKQILKTSYTNYYNASEENIINTPNDTTITTNASTTDQPTVKTTESVIDLNTTSINPLQLADTKLSKKYIEPLIGYSPKRWGDGKLGDGVTLTYSFMSQIPAYYSQSAQERQSFKPLTDQQKNTILKAFKAWENVANIHFVEAKNSSDAEMQIGSASLGSGAAWAYYPGEDVGGDVWLDTSTSTNTAELDAGGYGYLTIMHEIGHALGLKHPGNYTNGGIETAPFLTNDFDNRKYTIMSYNRNPYNYYRYSGQESSTPQVLDISAMQYLYGANTSYNNFDNIYKWDVNSDPINTIWDTGGIDTIDASNQIRSSIIDLRSNYFSSIGAVSYPTKIVDTLGNYVRTQTTYQDAEDNVMIADRVIIENAIGGDNNDVLIGNQANNRLEGGNGDDIYVIYTNSGDDTITDSSGNDTLEIHAEKANELSNLNNIKLSLLDNTKYRIDLVLNNQSLAGSVTIQNNSIDTLKLFDQNQNYLASINLSQQVIQLGNATPAFGTSVQLNNLLNNNSFLNMG